jgi:5-methylcytosine-specific restriction endonuclease McrA
MSTIHHRSWRTLRDRVVREEPLCWLKLDGCTRLSTTADHVIPRAVRPDLTMDRKNLRGACASCNYRRGARSVEQMRASQQRKRDREHPPALAFFARGSS